MLIKVLNGSFHMFQNLLHDIAVLPILDKIGRGNLLDCVQTVEKIERPLLASGNGNRIHPGSRRAIDAQWGND